MTKKCVGCGITLQDKDELKPGYTKEIGMDFCMRCFKLRNYNELITPQKLYINLLVTTYYLNTLIFFHNHIIFILNFFLIKRNSQSV